MYLFVCLFINLFIYLFIYLFIHLFHAQKGVQNWVIKELLLVPVTRVWRCMRYVSLVSIWSFMYLQFKTSGLCPLLLWCIEMRLRLFQPQCSPTQSVLFAEWASSPCPPPEPQTIEKHVNAMVEAVFKNYDNDRDGYISHEEFEAVAGNFPFIASFCVLDADQWVSHNSAYLCFYACLCHVISGSIWAWEVWCNRGMEKIT